MSILSLATISSAILVSLYLSMVEMLCPACRPQGITELSLRLSEEIHICP